VVRMDFGVLKQVVGVEKEEEEVVIGGGNEVVDDGDGDADDGMMMGLMKTDVGSALEDAKEATVGGLADGGAMVKEMSEGAVGNTDVGMRSLEGTDEPAAISDGLPPLVVQDASEGEEEEGDGVLGDLVNKVDGGMEEIGKNVDEVVAGGIVGGEEDVENLMNDGEVDVENMMSDGEAGAKNNLMKDGELDIKNLMNDGEMDVKKMMDDGEVGAVGSDGLLKPAIGDDDDAGAGDENLMTAMMNAMNGDGDADGVVDHEDGLETTPVMMTTNDSVGDGGIASDLNTVANDARDSMTTMMNKGSESVAGDGAVAEDGGLLSASSASAVAAAATAVAGTAASSVAESFGAASKGGDEAVQQGTRAIGDVGDDDDVDDDGVEEAGAAAAVAVAATAVAAVASTAAETMSAKVEEGGLEKANANGDGDKMLKQVSETVEDAVDAGKKKMMGGGVETGGGDGVEEMVNAVRAGAVDGVDKVKEAAGGVAEGVNSEEVVRGAEEGVKKLEEVTGMKRTVASDVVDVVGKEKDTLVGGGAGVGVVGERAVEAADEIGGVVTRGVEEGGKKVGELSGVVKETAAIGVEKVMPKKSEEVVAAVEKAMPRKSEEVVAAVKKGAEEGSAKMEEFTDLAVKAVKEGEAPEEVLDALTKATRIVSSLPDPRLLFFAQLALIFFWYLVYPPVIQNGFVAPPLVLSLLATSGMALLWTRVFPEDGSVLKYDPEVTATRADIEYDKWDDEKAEKHEALLQKREVNLIALNERYLYLRLMMREVMAEYKDDKKNSVQARKAVDAKLNEILLQGDVDVVEPDVEVEKAKVKKYIERMVIHANTTYSERSQIIRERQQLGMTFVNEQGKIKKLAHEEEVEPEFREHQSIDASKAETKAKKSYLFSRASKSKTAAPSDANTTATQ